MGCDYGNTLKTKFEIKKKFRFYSLNDYVYILFNLCKNTVIFKWFMKIVNLKILILNS